MTVEESKLLDSIASAEVEKQIVHNVLSTIKANQEEMKYEIGIETSLDEKDMVNYLQEVIKETRTKQRSN
jgi:exoribonuclease II